MNKSKNIVLEIGEKRADEIVKKLEDKVKEKECQG